MGETSQQATDGANTPSQARRNKPATGSNASYLESLSLAGTDIIIHAKAVRYIAGFYGLGSKELNALAIADMWLILNDRVNVGGSMDAMVEWSGARKRWKHSVTQAMLRCLDEGVLEKFAHGPGHAVDLTEKGRKILLAYDRRFREIKEDLNLKRIARLLKNETIRINKENAKAKGKRYKTSDYPDLSEISISAPKTD